MPVLLVLGAIAAIAVVAGSLGGGADTIRKKLGDALDPGGIRGGGGSLVRRSTFVPSGASSYPGGAADPQGAAASVLQAMSNAAQSFTSFAAPQGQTSPQITPDPSASPTSGAGPLVGGQVNTGTTTPASPTVSAPWAAQPDPTSTAAPTVPMLSPAASAPQYLPPTYTPPEPSSYIQPRDTPSGPAPSPQTISPAQLYPGDYGLAGPPLGATPQTGSLAGTTSPYVSAPAPAYAPAGVGGALDPGYYSSQYAYTAPNAGVSVAPPPGAGGGNTLT